MKVKVKHTWPQNERNAGIGKIVPAQKARILLREVIKIDIPANFFRERIHIDLIKWFTCLLKQEAQFIAVNFGNDLRITMQHQKNIIYANSQCQKWNNLGSRGIKMNAKPLN
jgi:hypothetical protein